MPYPFLDDATHAGTEHPGVVYMMIELMIDSGTRRLGRLCSGGCDACRMFCDGKPRLAPT